MGGVESMLGGPTYTVGTHRVTQVKQIAEGGFSFVDLVRDESPPHAMYALKRVLCQTSEQLTAVRREIALHAHVSHPFVVTVVDSAIVPSSRVAGAHEALILLPLFAHGSLVDAVQRYDDAAAAAAATAGSGSATHSATVPWPFPEREALRLWYALAQGVEALHASGVAHRDIKPQNVMLDYADGSAPSPVLIDLGSAAPLRQTPEDRRAAFALQEVAESQCTASYRAPELFDVRPGVTIDDRADLWSLAGVLYFIAFGRSAFENEQEGVMTLAIRAGNVAIPEEYVLAEEGEESTPSAHAAPSSMSSPPHPSRLFSRGFIAFLRELLTADPSARPTLKDAMKKCVLLSVAAAARDETNKARTSATAAEVNADDEFGAFASATNVLPPPPEPASDTLALLLAEMQLGSGGSSVQYAPGGFLKFGRKGAPHATRLQLVRARDAITYTSKAGKAHTVPIARIKEIVAGQTTSKFARFRTDAAFGPKAHLCFSLRLRREGKETNATTTTTHEEHEHDGADHQEDTLDLLAESHQLFRTWTSGIQALMTAQPPPRSHSDDAT